MDRRLYAKMVDGEEVRLFNDDRIQSAIDDALSELDENNQFAVVGHAVMEDDGQKVGKLSIAYRTKGGSFSIMAAAFKEWGGYQNDAGVEGKVVFKR